MKLNNRMGQMDVFFMVDSVGANRGMHYYNFSLVSALNKIGASVLLVSTPETACHPLRPGNVPVRGAFNRIYGNTPKWVRGLNYLLAFLRIVWWTYRERPGIAHFHFYQIPMLDYVLLRLLRRLGVRTITTVHDVLPFERGTNFGSERGKIYHRLYTASSGLILHSRHAWESLAALDSELLGKSVLIPQGGYPELCLNHQGTRAEAKVSVGLQTNMPIILIFGTIKPNKRLDLVLRALTVVLPRYPGAHLIVAGKVQDRDIGEDVALANQLGVASNVLWRQDYVTDEELISYFTAADVVVFPYQWIYQSAALLMAMSFRKAIAATAVGSNVDLIRDGETGILVPLDDPQSMAAAILKILDDQAYGEALGEAAHQYVAYELSWDKIAASTLNFYDRILGAEPAPAKSNGEEA